MFPGDELVWYYYCTGTLLFTIFMSSIQGVPIFVQPIQVVLLSSVLLLKSNVIIINFDIFQIKSDSRDGLLFLPPDCDNDEISVQFPNTSSATSQLSTSTLKRNNNTSAGCKRSFLMKEKRESIV